MVYSHFFYRLNIPARWVYPTTFSPLYTSSTGIFINFYFQFTDRTIQDLAADQAAAVAAEAVEALNPNPDGTDVQNQGTLHIDETAEDVPVEAGENVPAAQGPRGLEDEGSDDDFGMPPPQPRQGGSRSDPNEARSMWGKHPAMRGRIAAAVQGETSQEGSSDSDASVHTSEESDSSVYALCTMQVYFSWKTVSTITCF